MKKAVLYAGSYLVFCTILIGACGLWPFHTSVTPEELSVVSSIAPRRGVADEAEEGWPMLYHDSQRSGCTVSDAPSTNTTLWSKPAVQLRVPPIVVQGKIYINILGYLQVYNALTGDFLHSFFIASSSQIAVAGERMFVAGTNNRFYCYSTTDYSELWNVTIDGQMVDLYSPIATDDYFYLAYLYNFSRIAALDVSTGAHRWTDINLSTELTSDIIVDSGKLYCTLGQQLFCYDATTGEKLWESPNIDTFDNDVPTLADGRLYAISTSGIVYCLDLAANGAVVWQYATGDSTTTLQNHLSVGYDHVYVGTRKHLFALSTTTGDLSWAYPTPQNAVYHPVVADGHVYATVASQGLRCFDATSGQLIWNYNFSVFPFNLCPVITDGILYYCCGGPSEPGNMVLAFQDPNLAPQTPTTPQGSTSGIVGESTYSTSTIDPEGDQVWYQWAFGSQTPEWIGPFDSGVTVYQKTTWASPGTYAVSVRAKDASHETSWSAALEVTVARSSSDLLLLSITPASVAEGATFLLTATAHDAPANHAAVVFQDVTYSTDSDGRLTLHAPQVDHTTTYTITATYGDLPTATAQVTVVDTAAGGFIYGVVYDSAAVVAGVDICAQLSSETETTPYCATSDVDGRYVIPVPAGTYTVTASKEDVYIPSSKAGTLVSLRTAIEVDFFLKEVGQTVFPPSDNTESQKFEDAIETLRSADKVGGELSITLTDQKYSIATYGNLDVQVTDLTEKQVTVIVNGEGLQGGTILAFRIQGTVDSLKEIAVSYDGMKTQNVGFLEIFTSDASNTAPRYTTLLSKEPDGTVVAYCLLYCPSFSTHTIVISSVTPLFTSMNQALLFCTLLGLASVLFVVPVYTMYFRKVKE